MVKKEEQLLESALKLFTSKGFHGTSTAAIASNAGVSNGILFHYYKSKDSLIQRLYQSVKAEQIEFILVGVGDAEEPREKLRIIWKQSIDWALKNKSKYRFLNQYKYSPYKRKQKADLQKIRTLFEDIVEKGIQKKQLRYLPWDFVYEMTYANVYGMIEYLDANPIKYRTPEFMKQAFESFWESIGY